MSWLIDFVRPKIRAIVRPQKSDIPEDLWHKCVQCEQMIFNKDFKKNLQVCPHCQHHYRLNARTRLEYLFDEGVYHRIQVPEVPQDPLHFRDTKKYKDRLKEYALKTKESEAIVVGEGKIQDHAIVAATFDFSFMGGSMGMAVGQGMITAANHAIQRRLPLLAITASGGARMQEGILSLMQMPKTTVAVQKMRDAHLPYWVLLTDPTTGGVAASLAMIGDIAMAEPGALIGFAGTRVIEETIREKLPEGFQRAEYLLEHGMLDMVVSRKDLPAQIAKLIDLVCYPKYS